MGNKEVGKEISFRRRREKKKRDKKKKRKLVYSDRQRNWMEISRKKLLLIFNIRCNDHIPSHPISRRIVWNPSLERETLQIKLERNGRYMYLYICTYIQRSVALDTSSSSRRRRRRRGIYYRWCELIERQFLLLCFSSFHVVLD